MPDIANIYDIIEKLDKLAASDLDGHTSRVVNSMKVILTQFKFKNNFLKIMYNK